MTTVERPPQDEDRLAPGAVVGRYVVAEEIGSGGMGRVYRASDPRLARDVAIKVLKETFDERGQARAIREAHALARLNHPNVLEVFDVGVVGSSLFLAMEYVDDSTLGEWCRGRDWREVLDVFIQAGTGLWAAHQAGLVHRDFKPANVLVGRDGRARVCDFGLARSSSDVSGSGSGSVSEGGIDSAEMLAELTQQGTVVGTPAYMAPEQHRGEALDARSDQYAFCIALYEALYGARPFSGATDSDLVRAKLAAAIRVDTTSRVPRAIGEALLRGLRPKPKGRWPSMVELIAELEKAGRRTRWPLFAVAGLVAVGGTAFAMTSDSQPRCESGADRAAQSWTPQRRSALTAVYEQSDRSYVRQSWAFAAPRFDDFVESWAATRVEVCRTTDERSMVRDRQLSCLDRLQQRFAATTDWLASEPNEAADHLSDVVAELGAPHRCASAPGRNVRPDPPPGDEYAEFRRLLDRGHALASAGRTERGLESLSQAHRRAIELGYRPALVEVERSLGEVKASGGDLGDARDLLTSAYHAAVSIGLDDEAAAAAIQLVGVLTRQADFDGARKWSEHARAVTLRAATSPKLEADLEGRLAYLEGEVGNVEAQVAGFERALSLRREASDDPDTAPVVAELTNLGVAYRTAGRYDESRQVLQDALELKQRISGEGHPLNGQIHDQLGVTCRHLGDYDASRTHFEAAIAVFEASGGDRHPRLSFVRSNFMLLLRTMGEYAEAERQIRLALEQERETRGAEHPAVVAMMANLAIVLHDLDRDDDARDVMLDVLRSQERNFGTNHASVAAAHANLGLFVEGLGDHAEARRHYETAIATYESSLGPSHPRVAISLNNLGTLLLEHGELDASESLHRRAMSIRAEALGDDHADTATSMKNLADVLVARGDEDGARDLYERALAIRERALGPDHKRSRSTRAALEALPPKPS